MIQVSSSLHFVSRSKASQSSERPESCWVPPTDVYSTDAGLVIKVELSGVSRQDLEISVEGRRIRVAGHRPDDCRGPQCKFLAMEIHYGPFETVIDVPDGYDISQARAAYQNGFLRVEMPPGPGSHTAAGHNARRRE